ncbi:ANTAR domain-containing protein [Propylenella binzhouense]|uniref:ANTAR domain-containing protein n=1 Tax=Propylenella binzhouense TaxID=2555902 RepID=A0A964WV23_9HYPH|nr:ANTAR domain-containing protein [Propylenella binzhouense]
MSIQILRDLRGLRVQVVHPPDADGVALVEHLRRIGCNVEAQWPVPDAYAETADVVVLSIDPEMRGALKKLGRAGDGYFPTVVAVVSYEDPSTLELVLNVGAMGVIERPIRPFGLLTQLTVARSLWLDRRSTERKLHKMERKLNGIHRIQKAKAILMESHAMNEDEAYQTLRRQAMAKRVSMDEMANAIIHANDLLNFRKNDA